MLSYTEYERRVFEWLMAKHAQNPEFTFTVRQSATPGAETDYFIGTKKSNYFATSFWNLPVSFPGSSGECISLIFHLKADGYSYLWELNQTQSPNSTQNQSALNLVKALQVPIEHDFGLKRPVNQEAKMLSVLGKPVAHSYSDLEQMLGDIDQQLPKFIAFVDRAIAVEKKDHPGFTCDRLTLDDFTARISRLDARIEKHNALKDSAKTSPASVVGKVPAVEATMPAINRIFYGPPGTGKTYRTVSDAAYIVSGEVDMEYGAALKIFNAQLGDQIEFITFHQNYSYEDFIQGLRPDVENTSQLSFEKKDGVFKRIADRALKNLRDSYSPESARLDFDSAFNRYLEPFFTGEEVEVEVKMKKASFHITEVGEKSIEFRKNQGDSKHTLSINTLRRMYEKGTNDIIISGLQPYYDPILNKLLEIGKAAKAPVKRKNYIIIIDEINRANISRVFGELITLIEEDKRSHGDIPMKVTLPSGDPFMVPSNLYIIGTMNTADKSISLLDIALRRRFEFVPMYPLYEGLEKKIFDAEVLEKINTAIIKTGKGHDFTIGHAYFMEKDYALLTTINHKVIPLLLEYFMNDGLEVTRILAAAGITVGGWPLKMIG